jgi:hypothetical protein
MLVLYLYNDKLFNPIFPLRAKRGGENTQIHVSSNQSATKVKKK